jgi:hypothetical protein
MLPMETHWEQVMGNMITSLWGRPIHWEQHVTYGDPLGTGNGEHDNLIMGKTHSLGTTCYLWRPIGNR